MNERRLHKSENRMICGVCGGIAEYFNIDPTIVRIVLAVAVFGYGAGLGLYILAALFMPNA